MNLADTCFQPAKQLLEIGGKSFLSWSIWAPTRKKAAAHQPTLKGWMEKGCPSHWETENSKVQRISCTAQEMQQQQLPGGWHRPALPGQQPCLGRRRVLTPAGNAVDVKSSSQEVTTPSGQLTNCSLQCWVIHFPETGPASCKVAETEKWKNADGCRKALGGVKRIYIKDRVEATNNQMGNCKEKQQFYIK